MKRTSIEVQSAFETRGCTVEITSLGQSYRAGGEIFVYAPGIDPRSKDGFQFTPADFSAFDGTGYDGRGRSYSVWLVKQGDFIPCTPAEWAQAPEEKRLRFGAQARACGGDGERFFAHRDALTKHGLADFGAAFAALGL